MPQMLIVIHKATFCYWLLFSYCCFVRFSDMLFCHHF